MATTEQTVINRQAPFLEDYARKLLESSYQKSQDAIDVPDIRIAGFTPDQQSAVTKTREGIGTFSPFIVTYSTISFYPALVLQQSQKLH